jgi:uncharacterized membrane protein SirB2
MDYNFYKILHLLGLSMVVLSLGGIIVHVINGGSKESNSFRKGAMITHGVGLLLLLVAGFGMLAKLGIHSFPGWVLGKIGIWAVLGAFAVLVYKKSQMAKKFWFAVPALVVIAALLAVYR